TVSPGTTGFSTSNSNPVQVTGADLSDGSQGAVVECNMDTSAPTIPVPKDYVGKSTTFPAMSVGCGDPKVTAAKVSKKGNIFVGMDVITGTVGPPVAGTDSGGGSAATDALDYPCPPTEAQVNAGISCALVFLDDAGENLYQDISFTIPYTTTTTTTTVPTAAGCTPQPKTVTTGSASGSGSVTVSPDTCLQGGTVVTVTGSGLNKADLGSVLECNTATGEPTAWNSLAGEAIPVGCADPKSSLVSTSASGTIVTTTGASPVTYQIRIGTIGPPFSAANGTEGTPPTGTPQSDLPTDSNAQAAVDAAKFPCPPAGSTDGTGCAIVFGDQAPNGGKADQIVVPVSFNVANLGHNATPTTSKKTTAKSASTGSTPTSSSQLAFTGPGPGLWWLGLAGLVLIVIGGLALSVAEGPRRLVRLAVDHGRRRRSDLG
ncbi:MAG TPA: hypothetical protein VMF60_06060, partial [Acidimicrobiales bacterium]|nr:hypothetical protein [Acidimicrobiales bacterium]